MSSSRSPAICANLADLLASGPDAVSPLTGTALVARKVRLLVAMAGGYPYAVRRDQHRRRRRRRPGGRLRLADAGSSGTGTRSATTSIPAARVSTTHPPRSPLRVAYEAFVGPRNWIYSYDLTAVYRAVRPADPAMSAVGPGPQLSSTRGRATHSRPVASGKQYYLRLNDAAGLSGSIDTLLNAVPPAPGPSDDFESGVIGPAGPSAAERLGRHRDRTDCSTIPHPGGRLDHRLCPVQRALRPDRSRVQLHLVRAANAGTGGSTYGETSLIIRQDATHYAEFFVAGGTLTAW